MDDALACSSAIYPNVVGEAFLMRLTLEVMGP